MPDHFQEADLVEAETSKRGRANKPVVQGVYFLFLGHELRYVGRSIDCYRRIDNHRQAGREFDFASVMPLPEQDTGWIESALITALEPPRNRTLTPSRFESRAEVREPTRRATAGRAKQAVRQMSQASVADLRAPASTKLAYAVHELPDLIGLGLTRIWELIRDGEIRAKRVGRRTIILAEDLEAFLRQRPDRGGDA